LWGSCGVAACLSDGRLLDCLKRRAAGEDIWQRRGCSNFRGAARRGCPSNVTFWWLMQHELMGGYTTT